MATVMKRSLLFFALLMALPAVAEAQDQERRSPLADAPAIRRRLELRQLRFALGAGVGATVGQDFYHAILAGPKVAFHLTDWLAIGGSAQFNLTKGLKTAFTEQLESALDRSARSDMPGRAPMTAQALGAMNKISQVYGVHAELIPFAGKLALFSRLFASYDFYGFGGLGLINFEADNDACSMEFCPTVGMKTGASFGLGMRAFFNQAFALNIEARDVLLRNNAAGRDVNGDTVANNDDLRWDSNFIVTVNVMVFLPTTARASD